MTFTPRDVKDVSSLVAKKLELYMNQERREERFDTQGHYRTHPKMKTFGLMYQVLDATEVNKKSNRKKQRSSSSKRKDSKAEEGEAYDESDETESQKKRSKERKSKEKKKKISPVVVNNSLRVVPQSEAQRLTKIANKVFEEQDLDKLHVIHRYRPNSMDIAPITENGKVANYTLHVGSALNSKNYVDYYLKEGLHSSKKECAKRLQRLQQKKEEENSQSKQGEESTCDGNKGQSSQNNESAQPMYNPLVDQSMESLLSSSMISGNLTPIDKNKPDYNTLFNGRTPSSRASSEKLSKASSQLNKARMFANGYGYRIVSDSRNGCNNNIIGNPLSRTESRAEIASSEEYCKFSSLKNSSVDSGRTGDGCEEINKGHVQTNGNDLNYNKFQTTQSSILSEFEEDDSRAKFNHNNSRPSSQRSARSHRSDSKMSQKSYQSLKSSCMYMEGSMSTCTEECDLYDTSKSEFEPDTAGSNFSITSFTPRRSKKSYNLQPIQTLITAPEVPRLGITSDMNDSNGSWNSCAAMEYVTAEEKAKMHTDARALEDRINFSQERADDGTLGNRSDMRAERSLQMTWNNGDQEVDKENLPTDLPVVTDHLKNENINNAEFVPASQESNNEIESNNPLHFNGEVNKVDKITNSEVQNTNVSEKKADKDIEEKGECLVSVILSGREKKNSFELVMDGARRPSSINSSSKQGKERGKDSERGEDHVENMEFHRGQVPDTEKNKLLKVKPERGDDTPRTMAAMGRLTKSAKKRGISNYFTMGDEERGLEKEYFQPVEKDVKEMYVKSNVSDYDEDLESPSSSRPSSASSSSSGSTKLSDPNVLDQENKNGSKLQSKGEKTIDGRGDDSASVKSTSNLSATSGGKDRKKSRLSDSEKVTASRTSEELYGEKGVFNETKSKDVSGASRGSRSMHMKFGVGEGYCLEGEMLVRGFDEGTVKQYEETKREEVNKSVNQAMSREGTRPSSRTNQKSAKTDIKEMSRTKSPCDNEGDVFSQSETAGDEVKISDSVGNTSKECAVSINANQKVSGEGQTADVDILSDSANKNEPEVKMLKNDEPKVKMLQKDVSWDGTDSANKNPPEVKMLKKDVSHDATEDVIKDTESSGHNAVEGLLKDVSEEKLNEDNVTRDIKHQNEDIDGGHISKTVEDVIEKSRDNDQPTSNEEVTSREIPTEEKAFIEYDLSDNDVIKGAISGSASIFNEDNDTVIDFRPSSASTAVSVSGELYTDHKRLSLPQPTKIVEVTEVESNAGSARERQQLTSRMVTNQEQAVVHPAVKARKGSKDQVSTVLNIADVKLEALSNNRDVVHPAVKRRSLKETTLGRDVFGESNPTNRSWPAEKINGIDTETDLKVLLEDETKEPQVTTISDKLEIAGTEKTEEIKEDCKDHDEMKDKDVEDSQIISKDQNDSKTEMKEKNLKNDHDPADKQKEAEESFENVKREEQKQKEKSLGKVKNEEKGNDGKSKDSNKSTTAENGQGNAKMGEVENKSTKYVELSGGGGMESEGDNLPNEQGLLCYTSVNIDLTKTSDVDKKDSVVQGNPILINDDKGTEVKTREEKPLDDKSVNMDNGQAKTEAEHKGGEKLVPVSNDQSEVKENRVIENENRVEILQRDMLNSNNDQTYKVIVSPIVKKTQGGEISYTPFLTEVKMDEKEDMTKGDDKQPKMPPVASGNETISGVNDASTHLVMHNEENKTITEETSPVMERDKEILTPDNIVEREQESSVPPMGTSEENKKTLGSENPKPEVEKENSHFNENVVETRETKVSNIDDSGVNNVKQKTLQSEVETEKDSSVCKPVAEVEEQSTQKIDDQSLNAPKENIPSGNESTAGKGKLHSRNNSVVKGDENESTPLINDSVVKAEWEKIVKIDDPATDDVKGNTSQRSNPVVEIEKEEAPQSKVLESEKVMKEKFRNSDPIIEAQEDHTTNMEEAVLIKDNVKALTLEEPGKNAKTDESEVRVEKEKTTKADEGLVLEEIKVGKLDDVANEIRQQNTEVVIIQNNFKTDDGVIVYELEEKAIKTDSVIVKAQEEKTPNRENVIVNEQEERTPKTKNVIVNEQEERTPKTENVIVNAQEEKTPNTDNNVISNAQEEMTPKTENVIVNAQEEKTAKTENVIVNALEEKTPKTENVIVNALEEKTPKTENVIVNAQEEKTAKTENVIVNAQEENTAKTENVIVNAQEENTEKTENVLVNAQEEKTPKTENVIVNVQKEKTPNTHTNVISNAQEEMTPMTENALVNAHKEMSPKTENVIVNTHKEMSPKTENVIVNAHEEMTPKTENVIVNAHEEMTPKTENALVNAHKEMSPKTDNVIVNAQEEKNQKTDNVVVNGCGEKISRSNVPAIETNK